MSRVQTTCSPMYDPVYKLWFCFFMIRRKTKHKSSVTETEHKILHIFSVFVVTSCLFKMCEIASYVDSRRFSNKNISNRKLSESIGYVCSQCLNHTFILVNLGMSELCT